MTIIDTNIVIDMVKAKKDITENITAITYVEYPKIISYKGFKGSIIFPNREEYILAHRIQMKLLEQGKPQQFSDLLIAAIAVTEKEKLITKDKDFEIIQKAIKELQYDFDVKILKE